MKNLLVSKRLYDKIKSFEMEVNVKDERCYTSVVFDSATWWEAPFGLRSNTIVDLGIKVGDKAPNCFDLRDLELSYFNGEQVINENGKWVREGRQQMKPSKFLKLIKGCIRADGDKLLERSVELLATHLVPKPIKIQVSDKVGEIYKLPTAKGNTGTLGSSCMRLEADCSGAKYVDSYDGSCKIAYAINDTGHLISRALLWEDVECVNSGDVFKFMDRIYGSESSVDLMKKWASYNGYLTKRRQSYSDSTVMHEDKSYTDFKKETDISEDTHEGLPYFDTFDSFEDGVLYSDGRGSVCLQDTDGVWDNSSHCQSCDNPYNDDELNYCEDTGDERCGDCCRWSHVEAISVGDYTEIHLRGYGWDYVSRDFLNNPSDYDYIYISDDGYALIEDTFICEECGEVFITDDEMKYSESTGYEYCSKCYDDTHKVCEECGEELHNDDFGDDSDVCDTCNENKEGGE